MQQRLARGEAAALGELYDRFAALVHHLAHRVLGDEEAADRITREVFARTWEQPEAYDPKEGSLRSWLAALTHRLAVEHLRQQHRDAEAPSEGAGEQVSEEQVQAASVAARADYIVTAMPASLRAALDLAYLERRDYRQAAERLSVTEQEARRRLRLGLQLLSTAHRTPPPARPDPLGGRQ